MVVSVWIILGLCQKSKYINPNCCAVTLSFLFNSDKSRFASKKSRKTVNKETGWKGHGTQLNRSSSQHYTRKFEGQNKFPLLPGKVIVIEKLVITVGQVTRNFYDYFKTQLRKLRPTTWTEFNFSPAKREGLSLSCRICILYYRWLPGSSGVLAVGSQGIQQVLWPGAQLELDSAEAESGQLPACLSWLLRSGMLVTSAPGCGTFLWSLVLWRPVGRERREGEFGGRLSDRREWASLFPRPPASHLPELRRGLAGQDPRRSELDQYLRAEREWGWVWWRK